MITQFKIYEISGEIPSEYGDVYLKDYWDKFKTLENILNDIEKLEDKHIDFKLLHHKERNDDFFKIIVSASIGVFNDKLLSNLKFQFIPEYSTSWDWEEISISDIKYIITASKYNL